MIAFDLGSNTLRAVEIECNTLKRIKEYEKIVKTAEDMYKTGLIKESALQRVIEAIEEAKKIFDLKNDRIVAVATAALRNAKNKEEILRKIEEKTEIKFQIIDGEKEAFLTAIAVQERLKKLKQPHNNFLTIDLGGGSTEIVLKKDKNIETKSVNIGIVTFAQKYKTLYSIKKNAKIAYDKELKEFLKTLYEKYKKPDILASTGGTPTTIAAFLSGMDYGHYEYEKINGFVLSVQDIEKALQKLLKLDIKEREKWVGTGRGDLIIAGIYLLISLIKICGFSQTTVIDDSLREGAAIEQCKKDSFAKNI